MTSKMIPAKMPLVHKKKYYVKDSMDKHLIRYYIGGHPTKEKFVVLLNDHNFIEMYPVSIQLFEEEVTVTRWVIIYVTDNGGLYVHHTLFELKENAEETMCQLRERITGIEKISVYPIEVLEDTLS